MLSKFHDVGPHTLVAKYGGNSTYTPAISDGFPYEVLRLGTTPPAITLTATPSTFTRGENSNFLATIPCTQNCGQLSFYIDDQFYGILEPDSNGNALITTFWWDTPLFTVARHKLTVEYPGDRNYAAGSQIAQFEIKATGTQPTTTTLTIPPLFKPSDGANLHVHVSCTATCSGMVGFTVDENWWWPFAIDANGDLDVGSSGMPNVGAGPHTLHVHYYGNATNAASDDDEPFMVPSN